jgi:hypothetical protein
VDGVLVCSLDEDATCEISVPAGDATTIHVTDEADGEVCDDPHASLGECVCMTLEIHC